MLIKLRILKLLSRHCNRLYWIYREFKLYQRYKRYRKSKKSKENCLKIKLSEKNLVTTKNRVRVIHLKLKVLRLKEMIRSSLARPRLSKRD